MSFSIRRFADSDELARSTAELFATSAQRAVSLSGSFSVLLSGGSTPRRAYEMLGEEPLRSRIPWKNVHLFWGDERCVPPTHPDSNARMVRSALLERVSIPSEQVHPIICGDDPEESARRYEELLRSHFSEGDDRFDLVLLGLGEDGHTASLFPGSPSLEEREYWVTATRKAGEEIRRVSLTPPLINRADLVIFMVSGASKAAVLRRVLEGPSIPRKLPAQLISPLGGQLLWMVDNDAATLLNQSLFRP